MKRSLFGIEPQMIWIRDLDDVGLEPTE